MPKKYGAYRRHQSHCQLHHHFDGRISRRRGSPPAGQFPRQDEGSPGAPEAGKQGVPSVRVLEDALVLGRVTVELLTLSSFPPLTFGMRRKRRPTTWPRRIARGASRRSRMSLPLRSLPLTISDGFPCFSPLSPDLRCPRQKKKKKKLQVQN